MDALRRLWDSTEQFHTRFGTQTSVEAQMRVFFEEVYEFTAEMANPLGSEYKRVVEAADVIVTVCSALQSAGVRFEDIAAAIEDVAQKNDAKTWHTHEIRNGKISRKPPQPDRDAASDAK